MEQYIKWLEENPDLIIRKCNKNSATFKEVEADVVAVNPETEEKK